MADKVDRRLSIAPMMEWTDRHYRFFMRLITKRTLLYTEMVTANAILHGDKDYLIGFDDAEHPIALQTGGSNPDELAKVAIIAQDYGYDEINLNVGCPSHRVQAGRFGAALMAYPELVGECVSKMKAVCSMPITVKTRIGIEPNADYEDMEKFIDIVRAAGCESFTIHARSAVMSMTPKENRDKPKLRYDEVYKLKANKPDLEVNINGNIKTLDAAVEHLKNVDGVMIGRVAYGNPFVFQNADSLIFGEEKTNIDRLEVALGFIPYLEEQVKKGVRLHSMTRHILGLFYGEKGAKIWKRLITENAYKTDDARWLIETCVNNIKKYNA
jgi:tRNA-dihydrouridine synthase A